MTSSTCAVREPTIAQPADMASSRPQDTWVTATDVEDDFR
jgi:hypothetical protein